MTEKILRCKDCGNKETFSVSAVEHHTWRVDKYGHFMEEIDCGDCDTSDVFSCLKCGSYKIERIEEESAEGEKP